MGGLFSMLAYAVKRIYQRLADLEMNQHRVPDEQKVRVVIDDKIAPLTAGLARVETKVDNILDKLIRKGN